MVFFPGYTFDYRPQGDCTCVSHATIASLVLEPTVRDHLNHEVTVKEFTVLSFQVMIVLLGLVCVTYTLCSCYTSKTGTCPILRCLRDCLFFCFSWHD